MSDTIEPPESPTDTLNGAYQTPPDDDRDWAGLARRARDKRTKEKQA